jgi:hypothetical protein
MTMAIFGRRATRVALAYAMFLASMPVHADAGDAGRLIERLRAVDADIVAATREVEATHAEAKAPDAKLATRIAAARHAFEMIARDAATSTASGDVDVARKRAAVGRLLVNLEHARDAAIETPLPKLIPEAPPREKLVSLGASSRIGADCAHALTITAGQGVDTILSAAGTPRSALWLRFAPTDAAFVRVDTAASALDTDIALFGTTCPSSDAEASARGDDEFGLAAAVSFDARANPSPRYVRIRNLGDTGRVIARVEGGAAFSGRVVDERNGHALHSYVQAMTQDGGYTNFNATTDENGFYLVVVDPGAYYAKASSFSGDFIPEVFPDVPCGGSLQDFGCDLDSAVLLSMTNGVQQPNVDFALNVGGQISGVVRDDSVEPVRGAMVWLSQASGFGTSSFTDDAGRYSFKGLLTGNYFEYASADGFGSEIWMHIPCGGSLGNECNLGLATPIAVTRNALTQGIDFELPKLSSIRATVSQPDALDNTYWSETVYDLSGNAVAFGSGDSTFYPSATIAVPPGSYRVEVDSSGYFSQLWAGVDCPVTCYPQLSQGTIITVGSGVEADLIFPLRQVPTISGTITDATTGAPLGDAAVIGETRDLDLGTTTYTDDAGHYTLRNPAAGDFYVFAAEYSHQAAIYPIGTCIDGSLSDCDLSNAVALPVTYGGGNFTGIDLALAADGVISGRVTMRTPPGMSIVAGAPFYAGVGFYDANGHYGGSTNTDVDGNYTFASLPAGTWYATASAGFAYPQTWNGIDCGFDGCANGVGTPITMTSGLVVDHIDFGLIPADTVFGHVTDAAGAPVANTAIDVWSAPAGDHCGVGITNANGDYAARDDNGSCGDQYVSTDAPSGYVNQLYDGIACPEGPAYLGLCDLSRGTVVSVPQTAAFQIANFNLGTRVDPIFANGFDP